LELCSSLIEGGLTPSYGLIKKVMEVVHIPVNVLIRPRGGDFFYSEEEFAVMKEDIEMCKSLDVNGIVIGVLNRDGTIDEQRIKQIVAATDKPFRSRASGVKEQNHLQTIGFAQGKREERTREREGEGEGEGERTRGEGKGEGEREEGERKQDQQERSSARSSQIQETQSETCLGDTSPPQLSVTFSRAIDLALDPIESVAVLERYGIERVLTSGAAQSVELGIPTIKKMVAKARQLVIMAGGGVSERNMEKLVSETGIVEVHASGRSPYKSEVTFRREGVYMGGPKANDSGTEYSLHFADADRIQNFIKLANKWTNVP